ncbi:glycosyltransferase family 2 protein [Glaciimonas sp. CA11.2]|uniref:glycosyltransferase family 2 protein n=1 Tax=Glaciimonas sp. CA11.2 TaxID=3048601 RepID=UPI002AB39298|nr:glycosyltransferase family 2 protein [Glaciimonas sp. CA11.2]MDY7545649.1 glycosyltransferase family 2 protein [Glaciimonas sp. CA11.2]MEB0164970.1 glycosyltransferase family 2 protein [Glaciimonas sp. CA11.2]
MKISVITAVYNGINTIEDTLRSVKSQDYTDIDHVVIDGASSDGTVELIGRHIDSISTFISEPDMGIYHALNKGIANAIGDVVGFLHSDDMFASSAALSRIADAFQDPAVGAVYGDLVYVKRHDASQVVRYWRSGKYSSARILRGWMPPHPTFYVRRDLYHSLGLFNTKFRIAADYESILRILERGRIRAEYIPEVLVRMRVGGVSNRSVRNMVLKTCEDYRAMRMNEIGGVTTLLLKNLTKLPQFFFK